MRIVVTGLVITYPLGGTAWDYLQYVRGLHHLGHEVYYLEDADLPLYDPKGRTVTEDASPGIRHLREALAALAPDLEGRWCFRTPRGEYIGLSRKEMEGVCNEADLFLNVSGCCWVREAYGGCRVKAYVDGDPFYTQNKLVHAAPSAAPTAEAELIRAHDVFFTMGENVGDPECRVPLSGILWRKTRQPIVLEEWPFTYTPEARSYTTVMSWKTYVSGEYGGKDVELLRFVDLPARLARPVQIALSGAAPVEELRRHGWDVVDGYEKSPTPEAYRNYLRSSRGEWSVAKNLYVASRSGWFSGRSAAYLALGKPVVLQDTGFSAYHRTGEGLFSFATADEAIVAIDAIESDYRRHCEAARAIAERDFAAEKVLDALLRDAGF